MLIKHKAIFKPPSTVYKREKARRRIFTAGVSNSPLFFSIKLFFYFIRILSVLFCLNPNSSKISEFGSVQIGRVMLFCEVLVVLFAFIILTRAKHGNHYIASASYFLPVDYLILNLLIITKYAITINRCIQKRCLDCSAK